MNKKIKIVHFSDLHFGSGERYGSLNSETGLNSRFEDFMRALDKPIDFAIDNKVDLVIFTGDTYKHATPEPIYQKEFAARIRKLSKNNIPTILLVGNHDVLYRVDGSNALDIYKTLDIENVTVFNKIEKKTITTKSGPVEIIALPHVTKSKLLTKEDYRDLTPEEQDGLMVKKVKDAINGLTESLDPTTPSILIGHGTLENSKLSSEQELSVGKVLSYPKGLFIRDELDYVGFGHIHKYQVFQESSPLMLYAGSLERVDFGEEGEDKGYIYLEIAEDKSTEYKFISTEPRPFKTIEIDLTESESHQADLEKEISKTKIEDSIIRIRYKIHEEDLEKVDVVAIKGLLKKTFSFVIQSEIVKKDRTYRIADLDNSLISSPLIALDKYLYDRTEDERKVLIDKAKELMD